MNQTPITMAGWLGGPVTLRHAGDVPVASFRLACTPRHYSRREERWVERETQWLTVTCWRNLALNVVHSLRAGDPVFVHGRLEAKRWANQQGEEQTGFELEAEVVGHDLAHGTSRFAKAQRAPENPEAGEVSIGDPLAGMVPEAVPGLVREAVEQSGGDREDAA